MAAQPLGVDDHFVTYNQTVRKKYQLKREVLRLTKRIGRSFTE
jgi:hypothetical protein